MQNIFCHLYEFLSSSLNGEVVRASVSNAVYGSNLGTYQRFLKNDFHIPPALHSVQTGGGKATNLLIVTLVRALDGIPLFGRHVVESKNLLFAAGQSDYRLGNRPSTYSYKQLSIGLA